MAWVFRRKNNKYEVGYYFTSNYFEKLYTFDTIEEAEEKVHYLNGGDKPQFKADKSL